MCRDMILFVFFVCCTYICLCVCVCVCLSVYLSAMSPCVYVCIHVVLLFVQLSLQLEYIVSAFYNTFRRVSATIDLTPWKKTAYRARFVRPSSFSFPSPRLAAPLSINIDELTEITHRATHVVRRVAQSNERKQRCASSCASNPAHTGRTHARAQLLFLHIL